MLTRNDAYNLTAALPYPSSPAPVWVPRCGIKNFGSNLRYFPGILKKFFVFFSHILPSTIAFFAAFIYSVSFLEEEEPLIGSMYGITAFTISTAYMIGSGS